MKRLLIYSLFFIVCAGKLFAQVILSDTLTSYQLTSKTSIFEDKTANLPFEAVQKQRFSAFTKNNYLFPFSASVFWLKVDLKITDSPQKEWILVLNNPVAESVDFYIPTKTGVYQISRQGIVGEVRKDKLAENLPHLKISFDSNEQKTVYVRIQSQKGFYATLSAKTPNAYTEAKLTGNTREGFFSGLVLIRLFYILLLAVFAVRELTFRLYTLLITIRSLGFWGLMGVFGNFLSATPLLAVSATFLSFHFIPIGQALFVSDILPIHRFHPIIRYIFKTIIALTVILGVLIAFNYRWYWLLVSTYISVFGQLLIFGLYLVAIIRRYSINWYYSVPFLLGCISYTFLQMRLVGWLDHPLIIVFISLTFVAEIFVFGIFLGRIIIGHEKARTISEQQLRFNLAQNTKLQELDALKTRFFANISHEFRTPLTLILGPMEQIVQEYSSDNRFPIIQRNAQRLLTLINQLLDISKLESGQMKPEIVKLELVRYFRTLTSAFTSLAESRRIQFEVSQNQSEIQGCIDEDKVEKIVNNLLSNAFKFTNQHGKVKVMIHYLPDHQNVEIIIDDTGIGIEKARLDKIFNRFYQVEADQKRGYEGTGIGLALVKELVEVLKGTIQVESKENVGTTFTVKLPIDEHTWKNHKLENSELAFQRKNGSLVYQKDPNSVNNDMLTPPVAEAGALMLLIDDNADIRTYVRSIFEQDYQVLEAVDGQDGLALAIQHSPDIVICDLMMPRMDGFEFCKHLKSDERSSHIPVVMLTAKATLEDRIEGFELGADEYLTKPFHKNEIQSRVKNLLRKQEKLRHYFSTKTLEMKPSELRVSAVDEKFLKKIKAVLEENLSNSLFGVVVFASAMNVSQ